MNNYKKKYRKGLGNETLAALDGISNKVSAIVNEGASKLSLMVENTINKLADGCNELYSYVSNELNDMCCLTSDGACGDDS